MILCTYVGWNPPDCPPGIIEMYHVYVDGFLKTTVRASDKTRALVEGVDSAKVRLWRYRYGLYPTNQHRTGTEYYRYRRGHRFCVYWLYWGDMRIYIQDR